VRKDGHTVFGGAFSKQGSGVAFEEQKKRLQDYLGIDFGTPVRKEACLLSSPRRFSDLICGKNGAFLIGEAAGFISSSSFEGISYAILSGKLLSECFNKHSGEKKIASNTSGYTGVSFVKTYRGEPYNKWRAYIDVDGQRIYLGDFDSKAKAVKARKEAGEKGIKWYKDNKNKLTRDMRKKTKKYKNSKYRETAKKRSYKKDA
jgi:flavin-dependent dehydrogenase